MVQIKGGTNTNKHHAHTLRLQIELQSGLVHGLSSEDPLVLSELRVEGAFLQPLHLEGEARTQLLQARTSLVLLLLVYISG